jgi:hypothetical protein
MDVIDLEIAMKTRRNKAWTLLASLVTLAAVAFTSAALVLADQPEHKPHNRVAFDDAPLAPHLPGNKPLEPEIIGPGVPDKPEPDKPEPDKPETPIVPDKPEQPSEYTADVVLEPDRDGLTKFVVVVSGRTVDDLGRVVPDADLHLLIDTMGMFDLRELGLMCEICRPARRAPLPHMSARSDGDGRFRLRLTFHDQSSIKLVGVLTASKQGYVAGVTGGIELSTGLAEGVDVAVGRSGGLTGRVVDQAGQPIAGATVYAYGRRSGAESRTDDDGQFTLTGLEGGELEMHIWAEGYRVEQNGVKATVRADENLPVGDLVLRALTAGSFTVSLSGVDGSEYFEGQVSVMGASGHTEFSAWFSVYTVDGVLTATVSLDGLKPGTHTLTIRLHGERVWQAEIAVTVQDGPGNNLGHIFFTESELQPEPIEGGMRPLRK